jgi:2-oxoglutarate ferredoxin oxidoreductase subunit alpha
MVIEGNTAAALGFVMGGATVVAWYPITPSSSLCESMIEFLAEYRTAPDGKARYAVVQAEDELSSIGMVLGAGWVGARAVTATAGPGISLMSEFVGLGYYAEVPAVIVDVQRVGPSTGLPTRTAQGDILSTYYLSHGDTKHICVIPCNITEAYEFAQIALDLAERFQTPVFDMHDLDLGMNLWMSEPLKYPEKGFDRGKVLKEEDLKKLGKFERYADVDGDGIPYRTLPGTKHPLAPFFTRGSGHNERGAYTEKPEDYARVMARLAKKIETAKEHVPQPIIKEAPGAKIGIIAYGTTDLAMVEALDQLENEHGVKASYLRIRALPLTRHIKEFVTKHDRTYIVEQNRDGQMRSIIVLEVEALSAKLRSVLHYNGIPIDARFISDAIIAQERGS